jgi:hypothetical protein
VRAPIFGAHHHRAGALSSAPGPRATHPCAADGVHTEAAGTLDAKGERQTVGVRDRFKQGNGQAASGVPLPLALRLVRSHLELRLRRTRAPSLYPQLSFLRFGSAAPWWCRQ